jgi:hypothetical protein
MGQLARCERKRLNLREKRVAADFKRTQKEDTCRKYGNPAFALEIGRFTPNSPS